MFNSARIAELQTQLDQANAALATANGNAEALQARVDQLTNDLAAAKQNLETATAEVVDLKGQLTTVTAERDQAIAEKADPKAIEAKISAEVLKRCAAAGVPPVRRIDNPSQEGPKANDPKSNPRQRLAANFNAQLIK